MRNAAVFPFVTDGFPIVYMGQEHVSGLSDEISKLR